MRFLIIVLLLAGAFFLWEGKPKSTYAANEPPPTTSLVDVPAIYEQPIQRNFKGDPFLYGDATLTPLKEFIVTARVLSRKDYSDGGSQYAPTDLALGWGKMAEDEILDQFDISQRRRFFFWRTKTLPIPREEVVSSASNMHIIPSDVSVQSDINKIKKDQIVQLAGKLVNIDREDGYRWRTSTSRKDSGDGACELFFVESVTILE